MPDFKYIETLAKQVFNNEIAFDVALEEAKALNMESYFRTKYAELMSYWI